MLRQPHFEQQFLNLGNVKLCALSTCKFLLYISIEFRSGALD